MKRFSLLSLSVIFILAIISSCKHDPTEMPEPGGGGGTTNCDTVNVSYTGSVLPIFDQYCLSCHSGAAPQGGIDLSEYSTVAFLAQNGALLGAIKHEAGFSAMPQGGEKLSDCDIAKIEIWIRDTTFTEPEPTGHECHPDTVYFQNTILPLLQSSCGIIGCHDPGTASEDIVLTDYESIMNSDIIKAGDPLDSELYEVITEDDPDKRMPPPPNNPLTAEQKASLFTWIEQGALNNFCEDADCDTVNVSYADHVWPTIQNTCTGCHSGGAPQGGISLENYNEVVAAVNSDRFLGAIKHEAGYSAMPQNGSKLSDCKISQIEKWIEDGTPNN